MSNRPSQPRTRVVVSSAERQAIRKKHRENSGWTQARLAEWATEEFSRPIRQSVISDSLKARYGGFGETLRYEVALPTRTPLGAGNQPSVQYRNEKSSGSTVTVIPEPVADLRPASNVIIPVTAVPAPTVDQAIPEIRDSTTTEEAIDEEDVTQSGSAYRMELFKQSKARQVSVGGRREVAVPQAATSANMYFIQFFSRMVNNALTHSNPVNLDIYTKWFIQVYNRVSHNGSGPLNETFRAVLTRHAGIITGDNRIILKSRQFYGRALSSVQKAINSPNGRDLNPDLVSATVLLACYEIFDWTKGKFDPFPKHTQGTIQLIKLLGPERFTDEYGRIVVMVFGGQLMFSFTRNKEDYFLAQKEWNHITAVAREKETGWGLHHLTIEGFGLGIQCFMLKKACNNLSKDDFEGKLRLLNQLLDFRLKLQDWRIRFQTAVPPLEVPHLSSPSSDGSVQTVYVPSNARAASLWCAHLSLVLSTDSLIRRFDPSMELPVEEGRMLRELDEAAQIVPVAGFHAKKAIAVFDEEE